MGVIKLWISRYRDYLGVSEWGLNAITSVLTRGRSDTDGQAAHTYIENSDDVKMDRGCSDNDHKTRNVGRHQKLEDWILF